jgi:uncharacterized protein (TIGR03083 family)
MHPPDPVIVIDLFSEERSALLDLLGTLSLQTWHAETRCEGWSVKDVAAHLLADDLGRLSRQRDGHRATAPRAGEDLLSFINRVNAEWVEAMRRLSPVVVIELLRWSGEQTADFFARLDPFQMGGPVTWAGPDPAPVWLDLAREYTERWHHQMHIREAVEAAGLFHPRLFAPVLATFVRALPHTYRDVDANEGTTVQVEITGESGGSWTLVREGAQWALHAGAATHPAAQVTLDQDVAWRLFTKGVSRQGTEAAVRIDGDQALGAVLLDAVAIIA